VEVAGGFQLLTRPIFYRWLARMPAPPAELRLSGAALETLTIVGYRQPIMRADVEAVRGVQCGDILRQLMERGLVRIAGRHDSLGRPVLYGTTRKFLQVFGLKSLRDLPAIDTHRTGQAKIAQE
jgi:segregation and condensation protein B